MYNLDVVGNDNFFVGEKGWLVHNAKNGCLVVVDGYTVGRHGSMPTPRLGVAESHHGTMSQWMRSQFGSRYNPNDAPAVLMDIADHNKTRGLYNTWRADITRANGGRFDWSNVSERQIRDLGDRMFEVAKVPDAVRVEYWVQFR